LSLLQAGLRVHDPSDCYEFDIYGGSTPSAQQIHGYLKMSGQAELISKSLDSSNAWASMVRSFETLPGAMDSMESLTMADRAELQKACLEMYRRHCEQWSKFAEACPDQNYHRLLA